MVRFVSSQQNHLPTYLLHLTCTYTHAHAHTKKEKKTSLLREPTHPSIHPSSTYLSSQPFIHLFHLPSSIHSPAHWRVLETWLLSLPSSCLFGCCVVVSDALPSSRSCCHCWCQYGLLPAITCFAPVFTLFFSLFSLHFPFVFDFSPPCLLFFAWRCWGSMLESLDGLVRLSVLLAWLILVGIHVGFVCLLAWLLGSLRGLNVVDFLFGLFILFWTSMLHFTVTEFGEVSITRRGRGASPGCGYFFLWGSRFLYLSLMACLSFLAWCFLSVKSLVCAWGVGFEFWVSMLC